MRHDLAGHLIPCARAELRGELGNAFLDARIVAPREQPCGQLAGAFWILEQQRAQIGGIALRDAGSGGNERRQAAAERFVYAEPVRLIPRWVNQEVAGGEHRGHVAPEPQEVHAAVWQLARRARFPRVELGAGTGDDQVDVPIRATAQAQPRVEQRVEALPAIAERADE